MSNDIPNNNLTDLEEEEATEQPQTEPTAIVGIGASAGGLEALRSLLIGLRPGVGACYIIAQHLSPTHRSLLVDLLSRETHLTVTEVVDGDVPHADVIYVTPASVHVRLRSGRFELEAESRSGVPKPSIDDFFTSLADSPARRVVGVVLSGTGKDGAAGVRRIREAGGIVFAQDPADCKYDGMPRAAIETGCVDRVLPAADMGAALRAVLIDGKAAADTTDALNDGNAESRIVAAVRRRTGFDLGQYKSASLGRRIKRRLAATSAPDLEGYLKVLASNPDEAGTLVTEMFISVTGFFRDTVAFEALAAELGNIIDAKDDADGLRIWVPGCATGEEAYSIAIVVASHLDRTQRALPIRIFATDLDVKALQAARRGHFSAAAVAKAPAFARRFFQIENSDARVVKRLRDMIVFSQHNVLRDPPFLKLDLISCRNVLIYLQPRAQKHLLRSFNVALNHDGLLFVGSAESLNTQRELFAPINETAHLYRPLPNELTLPRPLSPRYTGAPPPPPAAPSGKPDVHLWIQRAHTDGLLAPMVVVDAKDRVVHVCGDVSPFLQLSAGDASLDVLRLAAEPLRQELRALLLQARKQPGHRHVAEVHLGAGKSVRIAIAQGTQSSDWACAVVVFEAVESEAATKDLAVRPGAEEPAQQIYELEQQLGESRKRLNAVIVELESANEELQSLNEELQSSNEELQSANEELETSNEELHATNEELITVNEELESRTEALAAANDALLNVKNSLLDALIVVDGHRRIVQFNPPATRIFALRDELIGTLLFTVPCLIELGDITVALSRVIEQGEVFETRLHGGREYLMRIQPYLNGAGGCEGAVISFTDMTALVRALRELEETSQKLREAERFSRATLDALSDALCVINGHGEIIDTNAVWRECAEQHGGAPTACNAGANYLKECRRAEANGDRLAGQIELGIRDVIAGDRDVFEIEYLCARPQQVEWYRLTVTPFEGNQERRDPAQILCVIRHANITALRRANQLIELQSRALANTDSGICIVDAEQADLPIVYVNPAFENITGYDADEVMGRNCRFLQRQDTDQPELDEVRRAIATGGWARVMLRNYRKDGAFFWNDLSVSCISDGNKVTHMVGVQRDVTLLMQSQRALKASLDRERKSLSFACVGTLEWKARAKHMRLSELHAQMLAGDPDLRNVTYGEFLAHVHPDDRAGVEQALRLCMDQQRALDIEYRSVWTDGTSHWLHTRGDVELGQSGAVDRLLALSQDITLRRDAEGRTRTRPITSSAAARDAEPTSPA